MRTLLLACALATIAGCGDDTTTAFDMSMPDLTVPVDMSLNGVVCGSMTCAIGMDCCVTVDNTTGNTSSTCIAAGGSCPGGAVLACDGPEDCGSSQFCCGTIAFSGGTNPDGGAPMFSGGNSMCTQTCDFNFTQGTPNKITTRLCHFDADCTGLTAFGQNLNQCCSSPRAPGMHFCAAALFGVSCP